jgi:predicted transcriptional regulator
MLTKEQVLESIKNMPEDKFEHIDILLERLIMLEKIYTGIDQADNGELIPIENVIKEMKEW